MAYDGIAVHAVCAELTNNCLNARVEKISQPGREEIIIAVRGMSGNRKIYISANPSSPRVHLTAEQRENPMQAPQFCMTLRKHLSAGRIISITQPDFERIIRIGFEARNEMGDAVPKTLVCEIMGKHSNIILLDDKEVIIDSIKRIPAAVSSVREVLPGIPYSAPASGKLNPLDESGIPHDTTDETDLARFLLKSFNGISPIVASETVHLASRNGGTSAAVFSEFSKLFKNIMQNRFTFNIYFDANGSTIDFGCIPMILYSGYEAREFGSISDMLEAFYQKRDAGNRNRQKTQDLRKIIQNHIERCVRKKDIQQKTLKDIENRDKYKLYGELITSNIYQIVSGAKSFTTIDFYNPEKPEITIPLDEDLNAVENAQRYFKRYNKEKRTFAAIQEQIASNDNDLDYLEGVLYSLSNVTIEGDIDEIRRELTEQGFLKLKKTGSKLQKKSKPLEYMSSDGFLILIGRNNLQNDELTLKIADNSDLWLHTKDIPGSHVIVRAGSREIPDRTISEAASLAAYYSKARESSLVPVDYCLNKNVKKPSGAKPGMVIYKNNKTAYVSPSLSGEVD